MMPLPCILASVLIFCGCTDAWSYSGKDGPSNWGKNYSQCNGNSQSPINIVSAEATYTNEKLVLSVDEAIEAEHELENNGHTAQVNIRAKSLLGKYEPTNKFTAKYKGETYAALQYHFHWGSSSASGSEHHIDGKKYAAEMHIVHWNTKYSISEMLNYKDGALVLGNLIKEGSENSALKYITDKLDEIDAPKAKTAYMKKTNNIEDLLSKTMKTHFYEYFGSLTTPPCAQAVTFLIGKEVVEMSPAQLASFRKLEYDHAGNVTTIKMNYRPIQPLNSRQVYRSFDSNAGSHVVATWLSVAPLVMIAVLML